MMKKTIVIIGILMLMIALFAGCIGEEKEEEPNCIVTKTNGYWKDNGDWYWHEYVYYVEVFVRNYGGRGNVKVWASATQYGETYTDYSTATVEKNGQTMITFRFDELSSNSGASYRGWVTL